ncbi:MAG: lipopolysaccharide assembly protein LapA domain-containing protein [Candidatus Omnitrophota bacterium]
MNWKIILILVLAVLVTIFIFQNHEIMKVNFLLWSLESSKAIVLFLTLLVGIFMGGIISFVVRKEYAKTSE